MTIKEKKEEKGSDVSELGGQKCPVCGKNTLTLRESARDVPYFGTVLLFSMTCSNCRYHKADVEMVDVNEPVKFSFRVEKPEDLNVRVIKSSSAKVRIGRVGSIEPGIASNGYVTNIEGLLNRMKHQLEVIKDSDTEKENVKKARNHIKKINRVLWGSETINIVLEDPDGNSGIISDKAEKSKPKK
jgi:zinc finger protein